MTVFIKSLVIFIFSISVILIIAYLTAKKPKIIKRLFNKMSIKLYSTALPYPNIESFKNHSSIKTKLKNLPTILILSAIATFITAFILPYTKDTIKRSGHNDDIKPFPNKGIAIYLLIDQSSSMNELIYNTSGKEETSLTRLNFTKTLTESFIKGSPWWGLNGRPDDLIGLISFARTPQILSPLTLDHERILKLLSQIDAVNTIQEDGSAIGYALFKAANLIKATQLIAQENKKAHYYDIKNSIIIMISDGLPNPNPLDKDNDIRNITIDKAADYAAKNNIKCYIISIDPSIKSPSFATQRKSLQDAAEKSGGQFYIAETPSELQDIYSSIDLLEKSDIQQPPSYNNPTLSITLRSPYSSLLIVLGLAMIITSIILETTFLKRVP